VLDAGAFTVRGSERRIELLSVARESGAALGEHVMNMTDVFTFPSGCHVAEVEVDPETGAAALLRYTAVDDYGRLINPMLTEGQVQGGVTQGIGQALLEHTVYDPRRPAAERLAHGLRAAARRRPAGLRHRADRAADRANPLGVKGSGQAGCIAAPQTIMAALLDALRPAGVEAIDMPRP
jgi:carbon-monoxide dehydrogenase large subunit